MRVEWEHQYRCILLLVAFNLSEATSRNLIATAVKDDVRILQPVTWNPGKCERKPPKRTRARNGRWKHRHTQLRVLVGVLVGVDSPSPEDDLEFCFLVGIMDNIISPCGFLLSHGSGRMREHCTIVTSVFDKLPH